MTKTPPENTNAEAKDAAPDNVSVPKRDLPPEALRALAEAEERRKRADEAAKSEQSTKPGEKGGPKGEEPTRFGDWEREGRAVDF